MVDNKGCIAIAQETNCKVDADMYILNTNSLIKTLCEKKLLYIKKMHIYII